MTKYKELPLSHSIDYLDRLVGFPTVIIMLFGVEA